VASWDEFLKAGAPGLKCWDESDSDLDGGSDDGSEHPPEARPPPHMGRPRIAEKKVPESPSRLQDGAAKPGLPGRVSESFYMNLE
jgi:hypothetical protein